MAKFIEQLTLIRNQKSIWDFYIPEGNTYIYGLYHNAADEKIRYIGTTSKPEQRWRNHVYRLEDTALSRWIQEIRKSGSAPYMVILKRFYYNKDHPNRTVELETINKFNSLDCPLFNQYQVLRQINHCGVELKLCRGCERWLSTNKYYCTTDGYPSGYCRECNNNGRRGKRGPKINNRKYGFNDPKPCIKCNKVLAADQFFVIDKKREYRSSYCKGCHNKANTKKTVLPPPCNDPNEIVPWLK